MELYVHSNYAWVDNLHDDLYSLDPWRIRLLQDNNSTNNGTAVNAQSDSKILRDTFFVYGIVFLVLISAFCIMRKYSPKWYNLRSWIDEIKSPIADNMFGYLSWIWCVLSVTEDEIFEECSLDFLCFTRLLKMGFRISLVGVLNAIWLMPLYATSPVSPDTANVTDQVTSLTIAKVPAGSDRLVGTSVAAYFFFGYFMYVVYHELYWYIERRHAFLLRPEARNYTVFVRNIPPEFRNCLRLEEFFRHLYTNASVLEVHFLMKVPSLTKIVARRDVVVNKLERAIMLRERTGREPTHSQRALLSLRGSERVNSIDSYTQELLDLNRDITERIEEIRQKQRNPSPQQVTEISTDETATDELAKLPVTHSTLLHVEQPATETDQLLSHDEDNVHARAQSLFTGTLAGGSRSFNLPSPSMSDEPGSPEQPAPESTASEANRGPGNLVGATARLAAKAGVLTANVVASTAVQAVSTVATTATTAAAQAASLLQTQDGEYNDSAFVAFSRLSAVHSTLQM